MWSEWFKLAQASVPSSPSVPQESVEVSPPARPPPLIACDGAFLLGPSKVACGVVAWKDGGDLDFGRAKSFLAGSCLFAEAESVC